MRAAIAIDDWKLPIFERRLSAAGFAYEQRAGLTVGTLHLYVETGDLNALHAVVRCANEEAARLKQSH